MSKTTSQFDARSEPIATNAGTRTRNGETTMLGHVDRAPTALKDREPLGTRIPHGTRGVHSEVGRLRRAILHRPGLELDRLTPGNIGDLLFDDVMWTKRAREEHDVFAQTLRDKGVEVFFYENLLAETLDLEYRSYP